jgi:hypothetical protein
MLGIPPEERARVGLMIAYSAAVASVLTVGLTVAEALFLSRLPAADTPYVFILPGIATVLTLLAYNWLTARFWFAHVAVASSLALLILGLVFRLLLASGHGSSFAVLAALFLYVDTGATVVIGQFWTFAGQLFNPREARRLFGAIAAGGTCMNVIAGLSLTAVGHVVGVENLLYVVVAALAACAACAVVLARRLERPAPPRAPAQAARLPRGRQLLSGAYVIWRMPLLRAIAGLTVLLSLLVNIAGYQFLLAVQQHYAGRGQAAVIFLGGFVFWTGLGALVVQLGLTGRVMRRFGAFVALLFYPIALALGAGAALASGGALIAAALLYGTDPAFRRTINDAAINALYLPAPAASRQRVRQMLDAVYALTFVLAGVVFLLMQRLPSWSYVAWSVPLLGLVAAWVALLGWTRRQYVAALVAGVSHRRLDFAGATLPLEDDVAAGELARILRGPDALHVIHVLQIISDVPSTVWTPDVAALLSHPSADVRFMALLYLEAHGSQEQAEPIAALLHAAEDEVRAAAVTALCAVAGEAAMYRVAPLLEDPSTAVQGAVAAGMLHHGTAEQRLLAARHLSTMLTSDSPAVRRVGIRALGTLAGRSLDAAVVATLAGAPSEARTHVPDAEQGITPVTLLTDMLGDSACAPAVGDALVQHGVAALAPLGAVLADARYDHAIRAQVPGILQRIGGQAAAEILATRMREPDERIREGIYQALAQIRSSAVHLPLDDEALYAAMLDELRCVYEWYVMRADLHAGEMDSLLDEALHARMDRALDRLFALLDVCYPDRQLRRARRSLTAGEERKRALAIELLDTLVDRRIGELLIPFLEAPAERVLEVARTQFAIFRRSPVERLKELADGTDPWLRACGIACIGKQRIHQLTATVLAALASDDPLICETALAAARRLLDAAQFNQVAITHVGENRFPAVRRYARALQEVDGA